MNLLLGQTAPPDPTSGRFLWLAGLYLLAVAGGCFALIQLRAALRMTPRRWQLACIAALVGPFVLSFCLPVYQNRWGGCIVGWEACRIWPQALFGPQPTLALGGPYGIAGPYGSLDDFPAWLRCGVGWLPNLLFPLGAVLLVLRRNRSAMAVGVLATLAACTWLWPPPTGLCSGYFVWLASMALLAVAGWCFAFMPKFRAGLSMRASAPPGVLPDPGALALFNQPQAKPLQPTEIQAGAPQANGPSSIQPPGSSSS